MSWMEKKNGRMQCCLSLHQSFLHYCDSHCLVPRIGRPFKPAFQRPHPQIIGMVAQAAEGLAYKAAALSLAAH